MNFPGSILSSTLTPLAAFVNAVSGFRLGHDEAMSPSKPAVVSGVTISCGPPPTGMKSLNSMYWPAAGRTCRA